MTSYRSRRALGRLWVVGAALLLPTGCGAGEGTPPMPPPAATGPATATQPPPAAAPAGKALVIFGRDTVVAEVARTPEEREKGLMYRTDLPAGTGMLFVFPDEQYHTFWMSNTFVPLDIAFLDSELRVIDIQQMEAGSTDYHDSKGPAMYALEVPRGWLAAHGVRVGNRARLVVGAG